MMESNGMVILPEIILAFGGLLIFCVGAFGRRGTGKFLLLSALVFLGATIFASLYVPASSPFLARMLVSNGYTRIFMVLIASVAFLCVLFSSRYADDKGFLPRQVEHLLLQLTQVASITSR